MGIGAQLIIKRQKIENRKNGNHQLRFPAPVFGQAFKLLKTTTMSVINAGKHFVPAYPQSPY